ncbi:MAG: EpsI family protein, partial [Desulfuromonadales bacterium]|nr:EpsI family protein [Desulfuromonadales bacterium]
MRNQSRYIIVYLLLGLTALFIFTHENTAVPINEPLTDIPTRFGAWTMVGQSRFDPKVLANLKPTDYLYRVYRDTAGNRATLYLGYHDGGPHSGPIHSPKHCLPGGGWFELSETRRTLTSGGHELPVVQAVYQNDHQKELFLYFFQVKGRVLLDEYSLKLAEISNSILYNRRDSAFIRISVPYRDDQAAALAAGEAFLTEIYPHI